MGPASSKKNTLRAMMRAGMDIARFNFSHGSHEEHRGRVDMVKNLREELNIPVALLLDTKGPEIRTKLLKDHKKITLEAGSEFTLTTGDIEGDETRVAITYENLYKDGRGFRLRYASDRPHQKEHSILIFCFRIRSV